VWAAAVAAVVVVAVDQVTKSWAVGSLTWDEPRHVFASLSWNLTINRGAAFSLGTGVTPILEVVAVVLVTVLAVAAHRAGRSAPLLAVVAIGMLLGGALSNLGDRVFRSYGGGVVDFIDAVRIGHHDRWPIFNVADASITVGAILLVVVGTRQRVAAPNDDTVGAP
jgi:signal peptidase II